MVLPLREGYLNVILGSTAEGRDAHAYHSLEQFVQSGFAQGKKVMVVRHPESRIDQETKIHSNPVLTTGDLGEVYKHLDFWETSHLLMLGASHFQNFCGKVSELALFAEALLRSGRNIIAYGECLDEDNKPFGSMPDLLALAQKIEILPHHSGLQQFVFQRPESRTLERSSTGAIYIGTGPMFSSKTTRLLKTIRAQSPGENGDSFLVFKWAKDIRYGGTEQEVTTHSGERYHAISVSEGQEILAYVTNHEEQALQGIAITESQMFPGIDDLASTLSQKGHAVYLDGLMRGFNLSRFGDLCRATCYATAIDVQTAICKVDGCGHAATESQRVMILNGKKVPVPYDDELIQVGGGEGDITNSKRIYRASCLPHLIIPQRPANKFELPPYVR